MTRHQHREALHALTRLREQERLLESLRALLAGTVRHGDTHEACVQGLDLAREALAITRDVIGEPPAPTPPERIAHERSNRSRGGGR